MSHHHEHDHPHDHHHGHDHGHDAAEDHAGPMPFEEKARRLLAHWIRHNDDHVRTYREWAEKIRGRGFSDAASEIEAAADRTAAVTEAFERALKAIR